MPQPPGWHSMVVVVVVVVVVVFVVVVGGADQVSKCSAHLR